MHRPFLPRRRGRQLLVAAEAICVSQACRDDDPSSPSTPSFLEFIRNRMAEVRTDDEGNIVAVNDLFASFTWNSMIQARISPSGVLHVAQFGGASTVYRMNYVGSNPQ